MEITEALRQAVAIVNDAEVPEDLRAVALEKVLDSLLSNSSPVATVSAGPAAQQRVDATSPQSRVADQLNIPVEKLDRVFDFSENRVLFSGDVNKLGSSKYDKVGNLIVLVLAALRWSGLDEAANVPDIIVRAEVDRHGLLDVSNYSKHLGSVKSQVNVYGSGKSAELKIKFDGLEHAKALSRDLAGES